MRRDATNEIRELRLALVCYGGVSLAVYMHGITKEVRKLVVASRAFDRDPATNPFATDDATERAYFDALVALAAAGTRVRVVVDVISGTSAGGINGVCLATALARDGDDAVLRDLWLERGDIGGLLNAPHLPWLWWRVASVARRMVTKVRSPYTPLKGDDMARWLFQALSDIGPSADAAVATPHLVPDDSNLRLVVTTTDLRGYERLVETGTGDPPLHDRNYRHVFAFDHVPGGTTNFAAADSAALALACRSTSSIPGAFPAVRLSDFVDQIGQADPAVLEHIVNTYFSNYADAAVEATATEFVDGGVLDNAPFDRALDLIASQRAQSEVVRHLVYLEPDPGVDPAPHSAAAAPIPPPPGWLSTAFDAVAKVRMHEPLLQQLVRLREFNERITAIGTIADEQMTAVDDLVRAELATGASAPGTLPELAYDDMAALAHRLHTVAASEARLTFPTYVRLKLQDAVGRLAAAIARANHYHDDSSQAAFVRLTLGAWLDAHPAFLDPTGADAPALLDQIDIGYRDRRLRFVLQGVNALYDRLAHRAPGAPARHAVDALKSALWDQLEQLERAATQVTRTIAPDHGGVFATTALTGSVLQERPAEWAGAQRDAISALVASYGSALTPLVTTTTPALWSQFLTLTDGWGDEFRQPLALRYVAFPIWDQLLFPIVALSDTPQFTPIRATRFSPDRATLLRAPASGKLRGTGFHHFAAFFHRDWRENDYLWGRLDGAELNLRLLARLQPAGPDVDPALARTAFEAVLHGEADLSSTADLRADLAKQAAAIGGDNRPG